MEIEDNLSKIHAKQKENPENQRNLEVTRKESLEKLKIEAESYDKEVENRATISDADKELIRRSKVESSLK